MKRNLFLSLIAMFLFTAANAQKDETKYERNVLVEEFTTEMCPNCPPVASMVKDVLAKPEYSEKVIMVAHHAGYYTDDFTTEADEAMMWFYNTSGTYAPAMMFDRYPNFQDGRTKTPVGFVYEMYEMEKYIKRRLNKKSHVSIDITAEFDNDKTLTVRVKGDRIKNFSNTDPVIFVYLTENNVPAKKQAGAGKDYIHAHVTRAHNYKWGDILKWDGDNYEYECQLTVDPSWNKEEMDIVVAISAFDVEDCNECVVENTRSVAFSSTNGIEDTMVDSNIVKTEYFTLDGVQTTSPSNGLFIKKTTFASGKVETKKVIF